MLYKFTQLAFLFILAVNIGFSDVSAHSDSLLLVVKNQPESVAKIQNLLKLGNAYRTKNQDSSLLFYNSARVLSQKLNDAKGLTKAATAMAMLHDQKGEYDNTKKYYKRRNR